ncbi:iron ABC transporter permease [Ensifer sp. YR511]|uniref:ABC transporter permease n=1 Tax=Ensifer sp. YR511 TaxID=1855294 RepID=UPI0008915605|nr:iron ABC transporter permease [Ensifer sp. YR511]SDN75761.1 iron(III) transport system permease protein [Ensifer sp. YR511]
MTSLSIIATDPSYRKFQGQSQTRSIAIQYGLSLVTVLLILSPIVPLFYQALIDRPLYRSGHEFTIENFAELVTSRSFHSALLNSLIFSILSTIIAVAGGAFQAILIARTNVPGRRFLGSVVLWPLFVSPMIIAFGWFILYGPAGYLTLLSKTTFGWAPWDLYSLTGMSIVSGVSQAPLVFLYCVGSAALADSSMEDAARVCGSGTLRILRRVTFPLMSPALIYSSTLIFVNSMEMLAIPLIYGEPAGIELLLPYLYKQAFSGFDSNYGLVGAIAVFLLVLVVALVWLQNRLLVGAGRYTTVSGKATRPRPLALGAARWPILVLVGLYLLMYVVLPVAAIFLRSVVSFLSPLIPFWKVLTLQHFASLIDNDIYRRAITNTLQIALFGGIATATFTALLAVVLYRSAFRYKVPLEYVAMLPRAVPGIVSGLGFLYIILMIPYLGELRSTIAVLVVVYVSKFLPIALGTIAPTMHQISADLDRSANVMGASWWTGCRRIVLPIVRPAAISAFVLVFIQITKEYATAVFLISPGSEVLGVSLLQAWEMGDVGMVAAIATVQIVILVIFTLFARWVLGANVYDR